MEFVRFELFAIELCACDPIDTIYSIVEFCIVEVVSMESCRYELLYINDEVVSTPNNVDWFMLDAVEFELVIVEVPIIEFVSVIELFKIE